MSNTTSNTKTYKALLALVNVPQDDGSTVRKFRRVGFVSVNKEESQVGQNPPGLHAHWLRGMSDMSTLRRESEDAGAGSLWNP